MRFFHNDHMAHKPLHVGHSDNATHVVRVFFVIAILIAILIGITLFIFAANYLSILVILLFSVCAGIAAAVVAAKMFSREKSEYISQSDEDMRANKKAETQKQIDAMHRGSSKIPVVKR